MTQWYEYEVEPGIVFVQDTPFTPEMVAVLKRAVEIADANEHKN